jgi:uncharacterized protein (TIRG00374 family)
MKSKWLRKVPLWRLIGPVIVVAAIWWAGPGKVWGVLSSADVRVVAVVLVLSIPMVTIKAVRWRILLRCYGIELGFRDSVSMYATGIVFSAVTPGRVGDMVKIFMLIKRGCSAGKAIACNVLDRLFDVGLVVIAGYGGMWYFSGQFGAHLHVVNIIIVIVVGLLVVFVLKRHLIRKMALKLIPAQYQAAARDSWNEIVGGFWRNPLGRLLSLCLWTVVFWGVWFVAMYLCAVALGLDIPFIYMSACAAMAMVISLLPITVAGVGTRDAAFILLLGQIGIERQESLALSALILAVFLVNCAVLYVISVIFKSS